MIKKKTKQNRTISTIQYKRDLKQAKKESEYLSNKLNQVQSDLKLIESSYEDSKTVWRAQEDRMLNNYYNEQEINRTLLNRIETLQHAIEIISREHSNLERINRENSLPRCNDLQATAIMSQSNYCGLPFKEDKDLPKDMQLAKSFKMGEKKLKELQRRKK